MSTHTKPFQLKPVAAALIALQGGFLPNAFAAPQDGTVVAGSASISQQGRQTTIQQNSDRAIINWRGFSIGADEAVRFSQPTASSATLNRVTGDQVSVLLGRLDANGQVLLINPNGVVIGNGARIDVGSLIATTANLADRDFLAGKLNFTQPGKPGAGISNSGSITAAEGGLVALVAPHVRNDGIIQAKLGKVMLGAADTFTIDFYGDGLINLALGEQHRGALRGSDGKPVDALIQQSGQIITDGGKTLLLTAENAGRILDTVINMDGSVRANRISEQNGKIVLSGGDGRVEIAGSLTASGDHGGDIRIFGGDVHLAAGARIDASGQFSGGSVHVGGGWQGSGIQQNANTTTVEEGATLSVRAIQHGNGGEGVVWSDGHTAYRGMIDARGGDQGGNGGRVEVSGKQTLDFGGLVDAGAVSGTGGFLLLDPAIMNIGLAEASLINRVLRLGVSTGVTADIDINVNSAIDGRGRIAGGGLTLSAGNNININDFIITNQGALSLNATGGTVNVAPGKGAFTGSAPINILTGGNLDLKGMYTTGPLTARSTGGALRVAEALPQMIGAVALRSAQALTVDQPIATHAGGGSLSLTADQGDIVVNAQIDGRNGAASSGALNLNAGSNVVINQHLLTQNAPINVSALGGTVTQASGKALYAGNGTINVTAGGNLTSGLYDTSGPLNLRSSAGSLTLANGIPGTTGNTNLRAAQNLTINEPILNLANGSTLSLTSDSGNIVINGQIDGRNGNSITSGALLVDAGQGIQLNESIVSQNGSLSLTARTGTVTPATGKGLFAGSGPITVASGAALTTGIYQTTGLLSLRSTGSSLTVGEKLSETLGNVALRAATDVNLNQPITNIRNGSSLSVVADTGSININTRIDAQDAASGLTPVAGGAVTMTAGNNINVNETIVTNNGEVSLTATNGSVIFSNGGTNGSGNKKIMTGTAPITVSSGGNFTTGTAPTTGLTFDMGTLSVAPTTEETLEFIANQLKPWVTMATTGKLALISTQGNVSIDAPIPNTTGELDIRAGNNVVVNEKLVNESTAPIGITAGTACTLATCPNTATQGTITVNNSLSDQNITVTYRVNAGPVTNATFGDSPEVDARLGNLTMRAHGDVIINEKVATGATLRISSTEGSLSKGDIGNSRLNSGVRPQAVYLEAKQNIGTNPGNAFFVGNAGLVDMRTTVGDIYATVLSPGQLYVNAGQDARIAGELGPLATLVAGRDVDIRTSSTAGRIDATTGRDFLVSEMTANRIGATVGRDAIFAGAVSPTDTASIWLTSGYNGNALNIAAGGNINFQNYAAVSIMGTNNSALTGAQPSMILDAGGNIDLGHLQTYGDVSLSANGNISLRNYIGPTFTTTADPLKYYFTADKGVNSLYIQADNAVSMTGARAVNNIYISAGTSFSGTKEIVSTSGTRTILQGGTPVTYTTTGIDTVAQLKPPGAVAPAIIPGPMVNPPPPPAAVSALPFANPGSVSASAPGAAGAIAVSNTAAPGFSGDLEEIPLVSETATRASPLRSIAQRFAQEDEARDQEIVLDIQSIAQSMDFGRDGSFVLVPPPTRR